jgi:hypothetical protein
LTVRRNTRAIILGMKENTGAAPQLNMVPQPQAQNPISGSPPLQAERESEGEVRPPQPPSPPRREGGQPGNQNARVHGFYSKYAAPDRQAKMDEAALLEGLAAEIVVLRSKIELLEELDPNNVKLCNELIRGLSLVMVRQKYTVAPALIAKVRKLAGCLESAANTVGSAVGVLQVLKK